MITSASIRLINDWTMHYLFIFLTVVGNLSASHAYEQYLRCYKQPMDKVLCDRGYQILIHDVYYADNGPVTRCRDSSIPGNLCKARISELNVQYYIEILNKCNGYRACRNLRAGKEKTPCNSFFNPKSDYVLLEYICRREITTSPSTISTTVSESTPTIHVSTFDGGSTTVSENVSDSASGMGFPSSDPLESSTVPSSLASLNSVKESNKMIALKTVLPLILIILTVASILIFLALLKRRKLNESSDKTCDGTEEHTAPTCITFSNATYETSATLPIRQTDASDSCYIYNRAATVKMPNSYTANPDSGSSTLQQRPLPPISQSATPYVDMTFTARSKNKIKAWFRNQTSKKGSRKEQAAPSATQEQESASAEGIYAEPTEPNTIPKQHEANFDGYCLAQACRSYQGSSPMTVSSPENHYAVSPVEAKSQPGTEYISMDGITSDGKDLPARPTSVASGQYAEIDVPRMLQDLEGVYSTPKNNKQVKSATKNTVSDNNFLYDQPQSLQPAEVTYANIQICNSQSGIKP